MHCDVKIGARIRTHYLYGSENECATHYTAAVHELIELLNLLHIIKLPLNYLPLVEKAQNVSFHNDSFAPVVFIHLDIGFLRTDISGISQAWLFHLILISVSFILISFTQNV